MHSSSPVAIMRRIIVAAFVAGTSVPILAAAQPTITARDTIFSETGQLGSWDERRIKIKLSAPSSQPVTVIANVTGTTAEKGASCGSTADFFGPQRTVSFPPNSTEQLYELSVCGDNLVEGNETLRLTLSNPTNATIGPDAIITIADNDTPAPSRVFISNVAITISSNESLPNTLNPVFTIRLNPPATSTVEVKYQLVDETATRGSSCSGNTDYVGASNSLVFAPGETEKTVTVPICNDTRVEAQTETFLFKLTNVSGAVLGVGSANSGNLPTETGTSRQVHITDDDRPILTVSGAGPETNSGQKTIPVTLTLNKAQAESFTVQYSTSLNSVGQFPATSGTACLGSADYIAIPPTAVTFAPNEVTKTINLTVCGDTTIERDERLQLVLVSTPELAFGSGGAIKITNDDMPTVSVVDANVPMSTSDTQIDVTVTVLLAPRPGEPATVSYATANGTLTGGVTCGGRGGAGYISTSGTLSFTGGGSDVPLDPGSVPGTFLSGSTQTRTFTVRVCNRSTPSTQAVRILLSNATNAVISGGGGAIKIVIP